MIDDVRRYIYGTVVVFVVGLLVWFTFLYVNSCGFTFTCNKARPFIGGTPIPTLIYAPFPGMQNVDNSGKCQVSALELMGAWVSAGAPEKDTFSFNDLKGKPCEGNYNNDIRPLFVEANIWYPGSFSCASCHSADIAGTSAAKLDLTTYQGIIAGSKREAPDAKGTDILGGGNWENSLLYQFTYAHPVLPPSHGKNPAAGPIVFAGEGNLSALSVTPTP